MQILLFLKIGYCFCKDCVGNWTVCSKFSITGPTHMLRFLCVFLLLHCNYGLFTHNNKVFNLWGFSLFQLILFSLTAAATRGIDQQNANSKNQVIHEWLRSSNPTFCFPVSNATTSTDKKKNKPLPYAICQSFCKESSPFRIWVEQTETACIHNLSEENLGLGLAQCNDSAQTVLIFSNISVLTFPTPLRRVFIHSPFLEHMIA